MSVKLADIVGTPNLCAVGELFRLDEISPADFVGREAQIAAAFIDKPLNQISRFRPPRAAIGVDRRGIGMNAGDFEINGPNVIDTRRHGCAEHGNEAAVL